MEGRKWQMMGGILCILFVVIGGFFLLGNYTIKTGNVGILMTFGKFSDSVVLPGLHFRFLGIQDVVSVDVKMQTIHYLEQDVELIHASNDGVIVKPLIEVLDSKNLNIGIELTVQFTPEEERVVDIFKTYGANYVEKLLNPMIRDTVRDVASQYPAEDFSLNRTKIGNEIKRILHQRMEELPFELNDIQLRSINLPQIVKMKIEEVQLAKQEEHRLAMIRKQKQQELEIAILEGDKRIAQQTKEAEAQANKIRLEAEARAFAIGKESAAVAEANVKIAISITPAIIQYESIKKWDGRYPQLLIEGKPESMMLQLPSISPSSEQE